MKRVESLKKNYEFRRMYQRGNSAAGGAMVIYCRRNPRGQSRLGLTASTKLGNAVKRNRVRRRMREVYRLNMEHLRPGFDVILVARSRTLYASWGELNAVFVRLCKKLGIWLDTPSQNRTDIPSQNHPGTPSQNRPGTLSQNRPGTSPRNRTGTPSQNRTDTPSRNHMDALAEEKKTDSIRGNEL